MKQLLLATAFSAIVIPAMATIYSTNWNTGLANGGGIPDGDVSGWSDTRSVSTMPVGSFIGLSVNLQLAGGWNGDLYAYLAHDGGFSVLLDRVGTGVSGVGSFGYGDAGMDVTLTSAGTSIHQYGGSSTFSTTPTGTWMTDNTGGSLASFLSTNPNGTWSLFIADLSAGGVTTVQSWGLQMDIVAVPEIETGVAAALAGAFGAFWLNRQLWRGVNKAATKEDSSDR
jgi:hypothetical protein